MTKSHFDLIAKSEWMHSDSCDFMRFNQQTPQHFVFERIITNVAASFSISYRDMMHANDKSPLYPALCLTILLLDRTFKNIFNMQEDERKSLIGHRHYNVLEDYKKYRRIN